ncbi:MULTISPECIES: MipA/OmpV family protein [Methylobacterium]|nr:MULTISPECIES: MipA/OmpV family protein [Methylobacterium]PIU06458.1 MAG: structural protein MipA [Methylobacterium sp. CG09_land_8_20_14_0_10_71_15]PIU14336.1 MAG: structural protein MipA [Methylobacterium sp. CG08_land_8_20_14_0_20_71_15]
MLRSRLAKTFTRIARSAVAVAALAGGTAAVRAADMPTPAAAPVFTQVDQNIWVVTLTANIKAQPRYPGASDYTAIGFPSVSIRKLGEPERFSTPDEGLSFALYETSTFRIGPTVRYISGRYYGDDRRHLFGFRDAGFALEPGVFGEFTPVDWLRVRAEIRHGTIGHHGVVGSVGADFIQPFDRWRFSIGPRFNFGDGAFARRYFGVLPIEALLNGRVTAFRPDSFTSAGVLGAVTYTFDERWAVTGYAGYNRIIGSSADSPLVRRPFGSPDQFVFGAKIDYSFTMPALF